MNHPTNQPKPIQGTRSNPNPKPIGTRFTIKELVVMFLYGLVIATNAWKYRPMVDAFLNNTHYCVFPWLNECIPSKSSPLFLIHHLTLSLMAFCSTASTMVPEALFDPLFFVPEKARDTSRMLLRFIWAFVVGTHLQNFGELPRDQALLLNGIPMILCVLTEPLLWDLWIKSNPNSRIAQWIGRYIDVRLVYTLVLGSAPLYEMYRIAVYVFTTIANKQ